MTRTDCPLYGDLTKLNDGALAFAFDLCQRRQHLPEYAEAFTLIQEEKPADLFFSENGIFYWYSFLSKMYPSTRSGRRYRTDNSS